MNVFKIATTILNSRKDEEFNIHSMLTYVMNEADSDQDAAYALAVVVDQLLKGEEAVDTYVDITSPIHEQLQLPLV